MNFETGEDFTTRRKHLAAQIARQRGELAQAYQNLEKPIHYAEYGMRGFGFLRSNPWVFVALPAAFSIVSNLFGLRKKKSSKPLPENVQINAAERAKRPVARWAGYAWELFQLYRRVRPYLP